MYKIIGARGEISDVDEFLNKVKNFSEENKVIIQVFDADLIYGKKHIISALEHAKRAMKQGRNTTNSIEKEILLYAAGERQLKLAIQKIGIKKGKKDIAIIFANKNRDLNKLVKKFLKEFNLKRDDKLLEGNEDTLKKFGLSKEEITTVSKDKYQDLILEKVAMVDVIK